MKPTDNHDVEDKNIISVVGSLAIAGQFAVTIATFATAAAAAAAAAVA